MIFRDIVMLILGIFVAYMILDFKAYLAKKEPSDATHCKEFAANPNAVEGRVLYNRKQICDVLALDAARLRKVKEGNYKFHYIIACDNNGLQNIRVELKKIDDHDFKRDN